MSYFKDFQQDKAIGNARSDASRALSKAEDINIYLKDLESKIDLLALKCQALWELLQANTNLSEEKLKEYL
jgi:hypothetical protein